MTLRVTVGPGLPVGQGPGGWLTVIPITGGTFEGPGLRGLVCAGGADWNTRVTDTLHHVLARYWIQTDGGAVICVENEGWLDARAQGAVLRTTPRFTCDLHGPVAHLNHGCYAGELTGVAPDCVEVTVWRLT
jgi:hypothetical protein